MARIISSSSSTQAGDVTNEWPNAQGGMQSRAEQSKAKQSKAQTWVTEDSLSSPSLGESPRLYVF